MTRARTRRQLILGRICYLLAVVNCFLIGLIVYELEKAETLFDFRLYHTVTVYALVFGFLALSGALAGLLTLSKDFIALLPYLGLTLNLLFSFSFLLVFLFSTSSFCQDLIMSVVKTILP